MQSLNLHIFIPASSIDSTSWMATYSWMEYFGPSMYFKVCCSLFRIAIRGGRTLLCTLQYFFCLVYIAQIGCKKSVGNQIEGIYLEEVVSYDAMSSQMICLGAFLWFATDLTMRSLLLWACMPQTWHDSPWECKPCQRTCLLHKLSPRRTRCQGSYWKKKSWSSSYTR